MTYLLAIDQGTTSTRAIVFDTHLKPVATAQQEFAQHYPSSGWVEHDPEDLWGSVLATVRAVLAKAGIAAGQVAGIGITNQRETTLVWDRRTGKPVHNAIVWQDRRTADMCARLKADGLEPVVTARTGLLLDPYFSATKIAITPVTSGGNRKSQCQSSFATTKVPIVKPARIIGARLLIATWPS